MAIRAAERVGRRAPLNLKATDELRAKIEQAASAGGRSMSHEVERRLELSFEWERAFETQQKMLAETKARIEEAERGNLLPLLHQLGYGIIRHPDGMRLFNPGHNIPQSGFIEPAEEHAPGWRRVVEPGAMPLDLEALERTMAAAIRKALRPDLLAAA